VQSTATSGCISSAASSVMQIESHYCTIVLLYASTYYLDDTGREDTTLCYAYVNVTTYFYVCK
jgi:hypothetical protein